MKWALRICGSFLGLIAILIGVLFFWPRPVDTTDPQVYASDGATVDYCVLPVLDGSGLMASDIPKAYTKDCGWKTWPMPVLAECTEPLADGVVDLRGLWVSETDGVDHVERVEQCGNRMVVTSAGIIHDFYADGTFKNGAHDVNPSCINIWATPVWQNDVLRFQPFGLPIDMITREMEGDQLIWNYPVLGEVHMNRSCRIPATN